MNQVWIIEDDPMYAQMLKRQIEKSGDFEAEVFMEAEQVLKKNLQLPKAVFLDYQLPGDNGAKVLEHIQSIDSDLPVIIVSGQEDPTIAVKLIKKGAYDYVTKTAETPRQLASILAKLGKQIRLKAELEILRNEVGKKHDFSEVMGTSTSISKLLPIFDKASQSDIVVSISGETGVGKETLARAIHFNSVHASHSFNSVQLGSIPPSDFERQFFGEEKDNQTFEGAFAQTGEGTLFLDELEELDVYNQAKLFQALKQGSFTPLNGSEEVEINCRIISSTSKNLKELVRTGEFREDLYYQLLGLPIHLPSLKDRRSDVLLLAKQFSNAFCRNNNLDLLRFDKLSQEKLLDYNWPGNVRELKAVVELACVMVEGDTIQAEDIRYEDTSPSEDLLSTERPLREYTAHIIEYFLAKYEGDIPRVAKILDIGKSTIYRMIKNDEIQPLTK